MVSCAQVKVTGHVQGSLHGQGHRLCTQQGQYLEVKVTCHVLYKINCMQVKVTGPVCYNTNVHRSRSHTTYATRPNERMSRWSHGMYATRSVYTGHLHYKGDEDRDIEMLSRTGYTYTRH